MLEWYAYRYATTRVNIHFSLKIMVGSKQQGRVTGLYVAVRPLYVKEGFVVWHLSVDLLYQIMSGAQSTIN